MNERTIGSNIRRIRQDGNLTLTELARRAGIAKSTLSKIETGQVSAPISTLMRLAEAVEVALAVFFTESPPQPSYVCTRADEGTIITRDGTRFGYSYEALALNMPDKLAEPFLLTIRPGDPAGTFQHTGQEFIYVLSGRMQFTVGDDVLDLGPGDSLYFDPDQPHSTQVMGDSPVRFLCLFMQHQRFNNSKESGL